METQAVDLRTIRGFDLFDIWMREANQTTLEGKAKMSLMNIASSLIIAVRNDVGQEDPEYATKFVKADMAMFALSSQISDFKLLAPGVAATLQENSVTFQLAESKRKA